MKWLGREPGRRMARLVTFGLALVALVFLLQIAPHGHANGQEEAACRLCQAAHVSATPAVTGVMVSAPLVTVGEVETPTVRSASESFFHHSDPRAPPSEAQL
jgi:predicted MFS family arabinose efflux permease